MANPLIFEGAKRMSIQISAAGLVKGYRKGKVLVPVLHGVALEVERGEHVAIVGSSGSGKSTLLHVLGLLDAPEEGQIWLDGRRIDNLSDRRRGTLRNRTFGFIFQFYHLLPELSALENVLCPMMIRYGPARYLAQKRSLEGEAHGLLERVGLGHRLSHKPTELSGGEMQRAAIARALAGRPEILLADEPTGNLDSATGRMVIDLLIAVNRKRGRTLVLVTHDPDLAAMADEAIALRDGRVVERS